MSIFCLLNWTSLFSNLHRTLDQKKNLEGGGGGGGGSLQFFFFKNVLGGDFGVSGAPHAPTRGSRGVGKRYTSSYDHDPLPAKILAWWSKVITRKPWQRKNKKINKRPLDLTAPLSNNRLSMIYSPMNTKWPWFDLSMPPKVKCHDVNWKTIYTVYDLLYVHEKLYMMLHLGDTTF